jgi:probable phosphoglycerate mutase
MPDIWLIRHGETPWTILGRHTGRTDLKLTSRGRRQAALLGRRLDGRPFALVLASPLARALETCRLAGYGDVAELEPDLQEWDYGAHEGRTTAEIRTERGGWTLWTDGVPGGETADEVGQRADRVITRASTANGDVALFAHGHLLRIVGARWLGLAASGGGLLALDTGSVSVLGLERERRVILHWNDLCHLENER